MSWSDSWSDSFDGASGGAWILGIEVAGGIIFGVCFLGFLFWYRARMRRRRAEAMAATGYSVGYTNHGHPVPVAQYYGPGNQQPAEGAPLMGHQGYGVYGPVATGAPLYQQYGQPQPQQQNYAAPPPYPQR